VGDVNERARLVGPITTSAGAAIIGLAAFLPWLQNGHASRSSFEMIRTAALLDVITGPATVVVESWYLVPLMVAVVWLAAALDRPRVTAAAGAVLATASAAVSAVVLRSDVRTGAGPQLALIGSAVVAVVVLIAPRPPERSS